MYLDICTVLIIMILYLPSQGHLYCKHCFFLSKVAIIMIIYRNREWL